MSTGFRALAQNLEHPTYNNLKNSVHRNMLADTSVSKLTQENMATNKQSTTLYDRTQCWFVIEGEGIIRVRWAYLTAP